ncbi:hypothetical protein BDN72DRAFT_961378 [Pluteus cervinus]|uniref:Uncharacterized protein n=1 Tax=Pluteus cervinus TaxID=181527 RepID=A0ACD3ALX8_9AGAR|nr:hypothetical protein BDN72DRAFT_961378 [Pluteus cervinus]
MALLTDVNSSTPTLTDLPTELLLKIFEEPGIHHTTIAQVSRRLNSIITLLFLSSQGIPLASIESPLPSLQITMRRGYTQYRVLSTGVYRGNMPLLAFDITVITHLSCTIEFGSRVNRLTRFIKRLVHVDQLVLHLERDGSNGTEESEASLDLLLDACVQRGCRDFEVWSTSSPTKSSVSPRFNSLIIFWCLLPFDFVFFHLGFLIFLTWVALWLSNPAQKSQLMAFEGRISFPIARPRDWEFEALSITRSRIAEGSSSQATTCGPPGVTRLFLSTPAVFLPRSQWLFRVFYTTSTLTTLTFYNIHFDQQHWRASFSWMTNTLHANLENLTISDCYDLPNDSLVGFIEHLKTLKRLTLVGNRLPQFRSGVGPLTEEEKRIDLPNLEEVLAPFDFVLMLTPRSGLTVNLHKK